MPSEAFHSAPNATALPALAPIRGRMKNDRALCPPQKYICSLLEGTILGNGTKRAAKRRHSKIQFFLLKGGIHPNGPGPPKRGPWALWAHFSELWGDRRYSMSHMSFFALL